VLTQVKSATHNRFSVAQYVPRPSREVQMHGSGPFLNSRESSYTVTRRTTPFGVLRMVGPLPCEYPPHPPPRRPRNAASTMRLVHISLMSPVTPLNIQLWIGGHHVLHWGHGGDTNLVRR
jgi:hypothetical protein